jgi:hypothetical protein
MYINPSRLSFSQAKVTNVSNTVAGFVVEYWGNDLVSMRAQGVTGSFRQVLNDFTTNGRQTRMIVTPKGSVPEIEVLDLTQRRNTEAYTRFLQLLSFYRTLPETQIIYDGYLYNGYFASFGYSESADMPLMFTFNWEFVSEKEVTYR